MRVSAGDDLGTRPVVPREVILTPDQRLRVFVSSTLQELAAERAAVRRAIDALHLAPVMFELGASTHPPRSLYRSYLEQSHVFVGIYWQRYGWVAPAMEVSGLEDEYILAAAMPRLVYVKEPAPNREPSLDRLLDRIRHDGEFSYKRFETAEELAALLADDLAVLLTESFHRGAGGEPVNEGPSYTPLPIDPSTFVGRAQELEELRGILDDPNARLVTLTGPGGIGKTRLALQVAAQRSTVDEVAYVPLAGLTSSDQVMTAVAQALGLQEFRTSDRLASAATAIGRRRVVLVLDSMEHVIEAAPSLQAFLEKAPNARLLVTSREALRLRGEIEFPVPPLALPEAPALEEVRAADAVRLFEARAAAVRRDFSVNAANAAVVAQICARLEGIPLAIELAAARARLLSPEVLLQRLNDRLGFLVGGARDLPERQRALRATIDWSYELLNERDKKCFLRLALFSGRFTLDAAEAVLALDRGTDVLDTLASLVDKSLTRAEVDPDEPRFRMLGLIRDYALEKLQVSPDLEPTRALHADFFLRRTAGAGDALRSAAQELWVEKLEADASDMRDAAVYLVGQGRAEDVATMAWSTWIFAFVRGYIDDVRDIVGAALHGKLSRGARGRLLAIAGIFDVWKGEYDTAVPALQEAAQIGAELGDVNIAGHAKVGLTLLAPFLDGPRRGRELAEEALADFRSIGNAWGEAAAATCGAWLAVHTDQFECGRTPFHEAVRLSEAVGDRILLTMARANLAHSELHFGRKAEAAQALTAALRGYLSIRMPYPCSYGLDLAARLVREEEPGTAAKLLAAADALRQSIGVPVWVGARGGLEQMIGEVRETLGPAFHTHWSAGRLWCYDEAITAAIDAVSRIADERGAEVVGSGSL